VGQGGLYPVGRRVVGDGRLDLVGVAEVLLRLLVELTQQVEFAALLPVAALQAADVGDGRVAGPEDGALVGGGQEAAVEVVEAARRNEAAVEDDEPGQVAVVAASA